jgi:sulfonate transport system substrate-binding protein
MKKIQVLLFAITLIFSGCQKNKVSNEPDPALPERIIRLGFVDNGAGFPTDLLGIAIFKGYIDGKLSEIGAEAEIIPFPGAGPAINEAFAAGQLDAALYGDVPNVVAKSNGLDTRIVSVEHYNNNAGIVVRRDSNITSLTELRDETVATQKGSYMHRTLIQMFDAYGLTVNDIDFVNMVPRDAIPSLLAGQITAALLPTQSLAKVLLEGSVKLILDCSDNPQWKGSEGFIVTAKYLEANSDVIKAVADSLFEALEFLEQNPDEGKEIMTKSGFSRDVFDFMYPDNKFSFDFKLDEDALNTYEDVKRFLLENELIKNDFSIRDWAYTGIINN